MTALDTLKPFLDSDGRLAALPAKRKKKLRALEYLASGFEKGRRYTEREVNALLNELHTFGDPATLRRELYDNRFMGRERSCGEYWLEENQPDIEALERELG